MSDKQRVRDLALVAIRLLPGPFSAIDVREAVRDSCRHLFSTEVAFVTRVSATMTDLERDGLIEQVGFATVGTRGRKPRLWARTGETPVLGSQRQEAVASKRERQRARLIALRRDAAKARNRGPDPSVIDVADRFESHVDGHEDEDDEDPRSSRWHRREFADPIEGNEGDSVDIRRIES